MLEVTRVLSAIEEGDPSAVDRLLPLVYDELRKLAAAKLSHENSGQTLDATGLVHEAYIRLVDTEQVQQWNTCHSPGLVLGKTVRQHSQAQSSASRLLTNR